MAEKKQKKQSVKSIYKVLAILGCVLFVVLMVVSSMGSSWLSAFKAVRPGDSVTIDITVRDASGNALVTSDAQLFESMYNAGGNPLYSKQLAVVANQSATEAVMSIPVYSVTDGWNESFALFGGEYDAVTAALVGMKVNEQKTVTIPFTDSMTQTWTTESLSSQGVNITNVHVGDVLSMAVSSESTLDKTAPESAYSLRLGEVTEKNAESVTVDFGYPSIDIKVVSIGIT